MASFRILIIGEILGLSIMRQGFTETRVRLSVNVWQHIAGSFDLYTLNVVYKR